MKWVVGAAAYLSDFEASTGRLPVAVRCRLGSRPRPIDALFDTGAARSIVGGALVEMIAPDAIDMGEVVTMHTRLGRFDGRIHRVAITLLAVEGRALAVDATALLIPDWPGPVVLGYHGFMDRMCFALEPHAGTDGGVISFGGA